MLKLSGYIFFYIYFRNITLYVRMYAGSKRKQCIKITPGTKLFCALLSVLMFPIIVFFPYKSNWKKLVNLSHLSEYFTMVRPKLQRFQLVKNNYKMLENLP